MYFSRTVGATLLVLACTASAATAQVGPPTDAPRRSWTADRMDFALGDVITVLIDEHTIAAANQGNFASDRRSRRLGVAVGQNVTRTIPPVAAEASSTNSAESRQRGEASRQNRFRGEMTVRVVELGANGLLRVEGTKVIDIDNAREELRLTGWVRPQDVSAHNLVDSWRLGDAELVYTGRGSLGRPRGGLIGRLLGALWP